MLCIREGEMGAAEQCWALHYQACGTEQCSVMPAKASHVCIIVQSMQFVRAPCLILLDASQQLPASCEGPQSR